MRISRPCYNKPHRCPGWVGGGWVSATVDRCDGGYITLHDYDRDRIGSQRWQWRWGRCSKCDVRTVPFALRRLDPSYHWHNIQSWLLCRRLDREAEQRRLILAEVSGDE